MKSTACAPTLTPVTASSPRIRSLAELTAIVTNHPRKNNIAFETRWQLCGSCTLSQCDPKAVGCKTRQYAAEQRRKHYWKKPSRERARNNDYRRANRDKIRESDRKYRADCRDALLLKRNAWYAKNAGRINDARRESERIKTNVRRVVARLDALEDGPVLAHECATIGSFA